MKICSVPECGLPIGDHGARGWCSRHYKRWAKRGGDPAVYDEKWHDTRSDPENLKKRLAKKWRLDPISGCWQWIGTTGKTSAKYVYERGHITINGKKCKASRVSYQIYKGEIADGLHVLHKCDNSLCVNPEHLYLGDHARNMRDMGERGRSGMRKLTTEQVKFIRECGMGHKRLRRLLGVSSSTIKGIKRGIHRKYG